MRLSDRDYEFVYSHANRLCVDIATEFPEGIGLARRAIVPHVGKWQIPGGRVDYNEAIETAVRRTVLQDLGLELGKIGFLGYLEYWSNLEEESHGHSVSLVFMGEPTGHDIVLNYENSAFQVFQELPLDMVPEQRQFLTDKGVL